MHSLHTTAVFLTLLIPTSRRSGLKSHFGRQFLTQSASVAAAPPCSEHGAPSGAERPLSPVPEVYEKGGSHGAVSCASRELAEIASR